MQIIHIQTQVRSLLGLLNDEGDVVAKQPVDLEVNQLTPEAFQQVYNQLVAAKAELAKKLQEKEVSSAEVAK